MGGSADRRNKLSMSSRLDSKDYGGGSTVPLLPEDEELMQQQSGRFFLNYVLNLNINGMLCFFL